MKTSVPPGPSFWVGGLGAKIVETWELSPDRSRLTVGVTLAGGRMPEITLTRVYDRGEEEDPEPDEH